MKNPPRAPFARGILLALALALPVSAARLAYEGFEYTQTDGTKLNAITSPGGSGWTGIYGETTTDTTTDGSLISPGLTYTGLAPTPGKAMKWQNGQRFYRPWGSGTYAAPEAPANGTYWYSLLFRPLGGRGTICIMGKPNDPQNGFGIRMDNETNSASGVNPQFKAHGDNASSGTNLNFTNGYNKTYFIVGKIVIDSAGFIAPAGPGTGAHSNTIWVYDNPTALPTVEPTTGGSTMTHNNVGIAAFRTALTGRGFGDAAVGLSADEVRIGTTFAEVFPPATLVLSPNTGVEGQELTFTWANVPNGVTAMELDPGNIPLTPSASGSTTLPAPAANETYTLTYTVGGIDSTLTQNFTAIPPSFTLAPTTAYPGQTLTFNWRLPIGSDPIEIDNAVGAVTINATGAGTKTAAAPSESTVYTLTYTYNGTEYTLTQNFTLGAPFVDVSPSQAVEATTPLTITWRVPVGASAVSLQSGPTGGPYGASQDVLSMTNEFGAGTLTPNPTPELLNTEYKLTYTLDSVDYTLTDTLEVFPKIFQSVVATGTAPGNVIVNPAPMNNGVLAYSDRGHVWASVPTVLQGAQFVKFAQNDKENAALSVKFISAKKATFFLLLDNRIGDGAGGNNPAVGTDDPPDFDFGAMPWVLSSGFVDSGVDIGLDENPSGPTSIDQSYSVYFRQVEAGEEFTFGAQNDGPTRNMYGIAGVAPQVVPVTFFASPAAINLNSNNLDTTLNWTVPVGVTAVNIVPSIGDSINVMGDTNSSTGVGSKIVSLSVTTTYELFYTQGGVVSSLGPITVHANSLAATPDIYTFGGSTTLSWQIPPGSTSVMITGGVGDVTADTLPNGSGSKANVTAGVGSPSYTLTYIAPGATTRTTVGPITVTVDPIPTTPFEDWMSANYPDITAPNNAADADPDGDGLSNFGEFAFSGNPGSGSDAGIIRSAIDNISGTNHLTLTFACRSSASFTGAGPLTGSIDGVDYTVRGTPDLVAFTLGLVEVTPAIVTGLPDPAPDGYEYRTFRVTASQAANPKAFMQAVATPTP
jgi:hypothetical protein